MKVIQDKRFNLYPENYEFCPRFKHDGIKLFCVKKNGKCFGVDNNSIIKNIKDNKFLLQCNYLCD